MPSGATPSEEKVRQAVEIFRSRGGVLRTHQARKAGIHPRTLYAMRDQGILERLSRGLYRLAEAGPARNPDLVTVCARAPDAVICLISALDFHHLTTQVPHAVYIAVQTGAREPRIEQPPVEVFEFGGKAFSEGIEVHEMDGVSVRVYGPEKTLADCFKYRNKIGLDTAVEALRLYADRNEVRPDAIMRYARICRVAEVMRPYLEALL